MPLSIDDFWKLVAASELLTPAECQALAASFRSRDEVARQAEAADSDAKSAAQWLLDQGKLTPYQASVLIAGRPGPFVFGPFVVTQRIERGRLTKLFRALFEKNQPVLLVLLAQLTDDPGEYAALAELATAAAAVKNPHVTRTHLATRQRSQSFIVAESLTGQSLEELLSKGRLAQQAACQVGFQIAMGLIALHTERLTHGGVSPRNIWITPSGAAKLMQFPLAPSPHRQPRSELPLADYVAPEWFPADAEPSAGVDIYALGCVLYQLLTGRVPFSGGTVEEKRLRHRRESPERIDVLNPKVPEELGELVDDMLAKDPILRCESANRVAHLLAPFATDARGRVVPPKIESQTLTPGYGAWKAPQWQEPPRELVPQQQQPEKPQPEKLPPEESQSDESAPAPSASPAPELLAREFPAEEPRRETATELDTASFVAGSENAVARRSAHQRSSRSMYVILTAAILGVTALASVAWLFNRSETNPPASESIAASNAPSEQPLSPGETEAPAGELDADATAPADAAAPADKAPAAATAPSIHLVDDDGETLWASPTTGHPLVIDYLPSGAQVILVLRPAALLAAPEGPKLLAALGPAAESFTATLPATLGVALTDLEQLTVGFIPDETLAPRAAYVMRLGRTVPRETLLAAWGNPSPATHAGREYYVSNGKGYYFPPTEDGRLVAIAPEAMLKEMLELKGKPLLRRGIEQLLSHSDDQRQLTLLLTPSYLFTDGRELLVGPLAALHAPLREFLDEAIEAVLLSADVQQDLFVELRVSAPVDRKPAALKELLRSRWDKIPDRIESYVAALTPREHGQLVVHRFPRMLQLARDYTRSGIDDRQVVLSTYLPAAAAHNILLGADLTLLEAAGESVAAEPSPAQPPALTAAAALEQPITLSFSRESLEGAVTQLAREMAIPIVIVGADLQVEGITRNQSINNFDQRDQPAGQVLRKLLLLANADGKLVYQVQKDDQGREKLRITTRTAVRKRGESLPPGL